MFLRTCSAGFRGILFPSGGVMAKSRAMPSPKRCNWRAPHFSIVATYQSVLWQVARQRHVFVEFQLHPILTPPRKPPSPRRSTSRCGRRRRCPRGAALQILRSFEGQATFAVEEFAQAVVAGTAWAADDFRRDLVPGLAPRASAPEPVFLTHDLIHRNHRDSDLESFGLFILQPGFETDCGCGDGFPPEGRRACLR